MYNLIAICLHNAVFVLVLDLHPIVVNALDVYSTNQILSDRVIDLIYHALNFARGGGG